MSLGKRANLIDVIAGMDACRAAAQRLGLPVVNVAAMIAERFDYEAISASVPAWVGDGWRRLEYLGHVTRVAINEIAEGLS